MTDLFSTEFQTRHARNLALSKKLVRFAVRPPVLLALAIGFVFIVGEVTGDSKYGYYFLGLLALSMVVYPLYFFWLAGRGIRKGIDHYRGFKATSVPRGAPNGQQLNWILSNYPSVLEGCGLTTRDDVAVAKTNAAAAAAGMYGRGRLVRAGQAAALAADQFAKKRVPVLNDVRVVDSMRSELAFEMLPGQTAEQWEKQHLALAAGFHIPRVQVDQPAEFVSMGLVRLGLYFSDPLSGDVAFDFEEWEQ